jgi:pimeloyl-ACP methyl ester carboxylesterase
MSRSFLFKSFISTIASGLFFIGFISEVAASACKAENFETHISGKEQCLAIRKFGSDYGKLMFIWLHGDLSSGGPANYHFGIAQKFIDENPDLHSVSIALIRPGYSDGSGASSTVNWLNGGRRDHYTKVNVTEVATAIERLKNHYEPDEIVLIGHSGGAATAAIILGMFPGLVSRALLVACPCDLVAWRIGASPWSASENPSIWARQVSQSTIVHAITGERDTNTFPSLGKDYIEKLKKSGIKAEFTLVEGSGHNSIFNANFLFPAIRNLLSATKN